MHVDGKNIFLHYQHINHSSPYQILLMTNKCLMHLHCSLSLKLCQHKITKALVK